jgi:hypothetical protein
MVTAAPWWSGIKHRFRTLNQALAFARWKNYQLTFVWGVSEAVAYCRYEDLLAKHPEIRMVNVSERELKEIEAAYRGSKTINFQNNRLSTHTPGDPISDHMFVFDLWGDFAETMSLYEQVPASFKADPIQAKAAAELEFKASTFSRKHKLANRIGIRVRVTENPADGRILCRAQCELDKAIKSIIRLPWYASVFIVTDSEYVQQMLSSHFPDSKYFPKKFADTEKGTTYVNRKDSSAMRTYMMEIACLTSCRKILNYGGFINEESVADKIIEPTCHPSLFGLLPHSYTGAEHGRRLFAIGNGEVELP